MPKLYQMNTFTVTEIGAHCAFVDGGDSGSIPLREAPEDIKIGDEVSAFVFKDVSDSVVATMAPAYAQIGECAYLEVVSTVEHGAYINWGLPKDLFLPYAEQARPVEEGEFYAVYVYIDNSDRPVASTKLYRHLEEQHGDFSIGQPVDLMIADQSDLGFKVVINNTHLGLIYHGDLSQSLELGTKVKGWIRAPNEEGKINVNINSLDGDSRNDLEDEVLERLQLLGGRLELSDKSTPDAIYDVFKVSKQNFKRALGSLYKQRLIKISREFIELTDKSDDPAEK